MSKFDKPPLIVFHDLDNTPSGSRLTSWPLHVTLVPYFYPGHKSEQAVINKIADTGARIKPFMFIADSREMFGANNEIPVTRVASEDNLLENLHLSLMEALGNLGCRFVDLTFSNINYAPHITHISSREVPYGVFEFNSLTIANKNKEIITVIEL